MKLARYEDENGRSAGTWLIKELPGLYVEQTPEGWRLCCYAPVGSTPFKTDPKGHAPGPNIAPTPRPPEDNPSLLEIQEAHGARGTLRGTWGKDSNQKPNSTCRYPSICSETKPSKPEPPLSWPSKLTSRETDR